jgi:hypothetical protein
MKREQPKQENDYTALLQPVGTKQESLEELKKWKEEALIAHEINQKVIEKLMAERKLMYSEEEVLKAQQAILCNTKDALMNENYIIEYLNNLKTNNMKQTAVEKLDYSSWRKKNTIMLIKGGWFGNQTPCYAPDGQEKTETEWKKLYEQYQNK